MCAYFKSALSITVVPATSRPKEGRLLTLMCPFAKGGVARHCQKQERPRSQRCYPFGRGRQGRAGDHHAKWLPLPLLLLSWWGARRFAPDQMLRTSSLPVFTQELP